jgi:hypothetical protein
MIENLIDCQVDILYNLILIVRDSQMFRVRPDIRTFDKCPDVRPDPKHYAYCIPKANAKRFLLVHFFL